MKIKSKRKAPPFQMWLGNYSLTCDGGLSGVQCDEGVERTVGYFYVGQNAHHILATALFVHSTCSYCSIHTLQNVAVGYGCYIKAAPLLYATAGQSKLARARVFLKVVVGNVLSPLVGLVFCVTKLCVGGKVGHDLVRTILFSFRLLSFHYAVRKYVMKVLVGFWFSPANAFRLHWSWCTLYFYLPSSCRS